MEKQKRESNSFALLARIKNQKCRYVFVADFSNEGTQLLINDDKISLSFAEADDNLQLEKLFDVYTYNVGN